MDEKRRQFIILVWIMVVLAGVTLFVFVYAPEPASAPQTGQILPDSLDKWVNQSVSGWNAMYNDTVTALGTLNQS